MIAVEAAASVDDDLCAAVALLVPQLSRPRRHRPVHSSNASSLRPATTLFLARDGGRIVGMLTLVAFQIPTGVRAWIEDVVVDEGCPGHRCRRCPRRRPRSTAPAPGARARSISPRGPTARSANRLYVRMGFERRETNVYRYQQPPDAATAAPA